MNTMLGHVKQIITAIKCIKPFLPPVNNLCKYWLFSCSKCLGQASWSINFVIISFSTIISFRFKSMRCPKQTWPWSVIIKLSNLRVLGSKDGGAVGGSDSCRNDGDGETVSSMPLLLRSSRTRNEERPLLPRRRTNLPFLWVGMYKDNAVGVFNSEFTLNLAAFVELTAVKEDSIALSSHIG